MKPGAIQIADHDGRSSYLDCDNRLHGYSGEKAIAQMGTSTTSDRFSRKHPALVSVVIPAHNAADLLPSQLAALTRQDYEGEWEVVVVDNRSTDSTTRVATAWIGRLPLKVVPAHHETGASYARNTGVHAASGDLIAFCDADDEVAGDWLSSIVEASLTSDAVGGAYEYDKLNDPQGLSSGHTPMASRPTRDLGFMMAVGGGNLAVWVDVFEAVGGFDVTHRLSCEDTEFCWRLQLSGYELQFAKDATIHCRRRDSFRGLFRQSYGNGRGQVLLYRKYRSADMQRSSTLGALKAWAWVILHLPDLLRGPSRCGSWTKAAGTRAGKIVGSVENRVLFL